MVGSSPLISFAATRLFPSFAATSALAPTPPGRNARPTSLRQNMPRPQAARSRSPRAAAPDARAELISRRPPTGWSAMAAAAASGDAVGEPQVSPRAGGVARLGGAPRASRPAPATAPARSRQNAQVRCARHPPSPISQLHFPPLSSRLACQPPAQRSRPVVSPPPVPAAVRAGIVPRATVLVSAERQAREILSAMCSALGSAAKSNVTALATLGAPVSDGSIVLGALFSPAAALALATASAATLKTPALPPGITRCVVLAVLLP